MRHVAAMAGETGIWWAGRHISLAGLACGGQAVLATGSGILAVCGE